MIITDRHEELCAWVELGIHGFTNGYDGSSKAIGIERNGKLICAVTYTNFKSRKDGSFFELEMGVFSIDKRWCNRHNLNIIFAYPFAQLKLERVQTICSADDEGVIMFNKRLGFTPEGIHRKAWHTGCDAISWSMLKDECKWLS